MVFAKRMHLHIVWFKRDLRIHDHQPLLEATEAAKAHNRRQANSAAVLPLYVVEPEYWQQDDASQRQWHFVRESLVDLNKQLSGVRSSTVLRPLVLLQGDLKEHLDRLLNSHQVHLYSHEETGNDWTFQRDIRVGRWCRQHGVNWQEYTQFGVLRPNKNRDHWTRWRQRFIDQPTHPTPRQIPFADVNRLKLPILQLEDLLTDTQDHCTDKMPCPGRQSGGTQMANRVWNDFLQERGEFYRGSLSSPLSAEYHCSRISPYLAWGCISLKTLMLDLHQRQLQATTNEQSRWKASLKAFESRLWWHCHFIQKLEDEPEQEWRSLHPAYRNLREHNEEKFQAWSQGRTGWPLADACMRYLNHTGWLNFRMRAMLMSLACYPLWLPWQQPARYLARQFVDYEPGIH
ncbi:MAG: FAD-binding domain-containing protein, partial [Oceanobacter sp.]